MFLWTLRLCIHRKRPKGFISIARQFHIHLAIAMNEAARHAVGFGYHIGSQAAHCHFFKQDADLQFGQSRAYATVDAISKCQMATRVFAIDNQLVWVFEHRLITVGL